MTNNVLLGVTGSVAAIKVPRLYQALRQAGYAVRVVATQASLYFFDPAELDPSYPGRNPAVVSLDEDEWPGRQAGRRYQPQDPVLHIELRRWADLLLIAPLDANTLAKLAHGLADNCLTCVWRAWDRQRPVVLAPAMNTLMWDHPLTRLHLQQLASLTGCRLCIVPPQEKQLACGDVGLGALAEVEQIVDAVRQLLPLPSRSP